MDPNLIHVDWERTFEALILVIVLAFLIERALSVVLETELFIKYFDKPGVKAFIASAVAIWVCVEWQFDAVSMIILTERTRPIGYVVTGLVVAGGSKASLKLFRDFLEIRSSAYERKDELQAEREVERIETLTENPNEAKLTQARKLTRKLKARAAVNGDTGAVASLALDAETLVNSASATRTKPKAQAAS